MKRVWIAIVAVLMTGTPGVRAGDQIDWGRLADLWAAFEKQIAETEALIEDSFLQGGVFLLPGAGAIWGGTPPILMDAEAGGRLWEAPETVGGKPLAPIFRTHLEVKEGRDYLYLEFPNEELHKGDWNRGVPWAVEGGMRMPSS